MQGIPAMMYLTPKKRKKSVFVLSQQCQYILSIKTLSKHIAAIFRWIYEKVKKYYTKQKVWSGIMIWIIHNSSPVMCSINKLNKRKAAKSMSIF